eukprot:6026918-Amphidinium_carterae.1
MGKCTELNMAYSWIFHEQAFMLVSNVDHNDLQNAEDEEIGEHAVCVYVGFVPRIVLSINIFSNRCARKGRQLVQWSDSRDDGMNVDM